MIAFEIIDKDVSRFQNLFQQHFGSELDHDTAHQKLSLLVRQINAIYQPITKSQLANLRSEP